MAGGRVELPHLTDGYLGPQAKFQQYGLTTISHSEPVIWMADDQPEVDVILGTQPGTRITTKLISWERKNECNQNCLVRAMGSTYSFLIRPPMPGFYKFQIYALPADEAGPQLLGVYNYFIHCPGYFGGDQQMFPKQFPMWKDGGYLYEPLSLPKNVRHPAVRFHLCVPNARDVQIKVDNLWTQLQETEPEIFEGLVDFSRGYPSGSKAKVNVKYSGNNYNTLLEYSL